MKPNNNFLAVYNPFTKQLSVMYGDCITNHEFTEEEEWVVVNMNGDMEHPNYLHIQLDYDESLQLLFYPRVEGDDSLNEDMGVYFNSNYMNNIPSKIKLAFSDASFKDHKQKIIENYHIEHESTILKIK